MNAFQVVVDPDVMRRAIAMAQANWPTVRVSDAVFAAYLTRIGAIPDAVESHGADLALACACASGDREALLVFDTVHISAVASHVTRLHLSAELTEELQQLVRVRLFTGPAPRILHYSGKGPLAAWLRIVTIRLAINELHAQAPEFQLDAKTLESMVAGGAGPEDGALRALWKPRLRDAIEAALAALSTRDKTILRLHYIEGLNIEAIGTIYQVHRATVARWLFAIRTDVLARIRTQVALALPTTTSEVRATFAQLESELHVSISRVLGPAGRPTP